MIYALSFLFFFLSGFAIGKRYANNELKKALGDVFKALKVPDGCEIESISYRKIGESYERK